MTTLDPPVLADAHVHLHRCFDLDSFLYAAEANFRRASSILGLEAPALGLLVLTAGGGDRSLGELRSEFTGGPGPEWALEQTGEGLSLLARRRGRVRMALVAGRQIATAEGLEVLALGCDEELPVGLPIHDTLEAIREAGSLAVVPWGFGKWWGRRGRVLNDLLETQEPHAFFLGDNGGRPEVLSRPGLFDKARRRGIRDLPGSDPFPLAGEVRRVGLRGSVIPRRLECETPAANLLAVLQDPSFSPAPFGTGEKILPFLARQVGIRLVKLRSRRAS